MLSTKSCLRLHIAHRRTTTCWSCRAQLVGKCHQKRFRNSSTQGVKPQSGQPKTIRQQRVEELYISVACTAKESLTTTPMSLMLARFFWDSEMGRLCPIESSERPECCVRPERPVENRASVRRVHAPKYASRYRYLLDPCNFGNDDLYYMHDPTCP